MTAGVAMAGAWGGIGESKETEGKLLNSDDPASCGFLTQCYFDDDRQYNAGSCERLECEHMTSRRQRYKYIAPLVRNR